MVRFIMFAAAIWWGFTASSVAVGVAMMGGWLIGLPLTLFGLLIAWLPLVLLIRHGSSMKKKKNEKETNAKTELMARAGLKEGDKFFHLEGNTGVAVNTDTKQIYLSIGAKWKTYSYKDIRSWKVNQASGGGVVPIGGGFGNSVAAVAMSARADATNRANTGLFLQVRDIDDPEWRVAMSDRAIQNRWFEILTQEINEGGISAS